MFEVLLPGELRLPCVYVGFFPYKLLSENNPHSFYFKILQDTWIFPEVILP